VRERGNRGKGGRDQCINSKREERENKSERERERGVSDEISERVRNVNK